MRVIYLLVFCFSLVLATARPAAAEIKTAPSGQACDSTDTGVPHDKDGKHYLCDTCVVNKECLPQGEKINCGKVTHWSNCEEQATRTPGGPKQPPKAEIPTGPMKNR
jgi:hypothetical protein